MKLTIDLVPSSLWGFSLYNFYSRANPGRWKEIKEDLKAREGEKCWICGQQGRPFRLEAHEFWEYDLNTKVQKLIAIHHLCVWCHRVKHIGRTLFTADGRMELGDKGEKRLVNHFCRVNECSRSDFDRHVKESFQLFRERNRVNWYQDFGIFEREIMDLLLRKEK